MEFYYESSNGQIRDSSGELCHALKKNGWQKKDAKYIKREWKNGKWVYTYPDDAKGKKNTRTPALVDKSKKNVEIKKQGKIAKMIDNIKNKIDNYSEGRKKDWDESKERATAKAKAEAAKEGAKLNDTDKRRSSTTIFETSSAIAGSNKIGKSKTVTKNRGTVEQFIDTAKEYIKDRFGYDERDESESAKTREEETKASADRASKTYDRMRDAAADDMYITDEERKMVETSKTLKNLMDKRHSDAVESRKAAEENFFNTPLGKLEKIRTSTKDWINDLFDGKSGMEDVLDDWITYSKERKKEEAAAEEEKARQEKYELAKKETAKTAGLLPAFKKLMDNLAKYNPFPKLSLKEHPYTSEQDMTLVNPNYARGGSYDENCAVCTITYDLRKRGYDVEAMPEEVTRDNGSLGLTMEKIAKLYGLKKRDIKTTCDGDFLDAYISKDNISIDKVRQDLKELETELLKYGNGARGNLGVHWRVGGGHSISWEVENGAVVIRDTQTNRMHTLDDYVEDIYYFDYIRTDNVEPTDEILKYVRNRGER